MDNKYTQEQVDDIRAREQEALEALKRLQLTPACQITKENLGNDVFADRLYPYLADTRYVRQSDGKFANKGLESPYVEPPKQP
jgi:hypothetical protein